MCDVLAGEALGGVAVAGLDRVEDALVLERILGELLGRHLLRVDVQAEPPGPQRLGEVDQERVAGGDGELEMERARGGVRRLRTAPGGREGLAQLRQLGGDPNTFDGPVILARRGELDQTLPLVSQWNENSRGLGLQDLCRAVRDGTPQRASGELGLQVLETLLDIRDCALSGV